MKLEQQVVSLELAKKLKELGVKQESYFFWVYNTALASDTQVKRKIDTGSWKNTKKMQDGGVIKYYSAFTVAELGEMLPDSRGECDVMLYKVLNVYTSALMKQNKMIWSTAENTEADARASMLIYLLENNLIHSLK